MNVKRIIEVITLIKKARYKAYLVGGSSRDYIYGRDFLDVDIATNAPLDFLKKTFEIENNDGASMGSLKIKYKGQTMEITCFREEEYSLKSSFPKIKKFLKEPEEDAKRRDFTINAIYLDLTNNEIVDPYDGIKDLFNFVIKFIGDPKERIQEDPSRILRGLRLSKKMNFVIEEETKKAFIDYKNELDRLSNNKFNKEIEKMIIDLGESKTKALLDEYQIQLRRSE